MFLNISNLYFLLIKSTFINSKSYQRVETQNFSSVQGCRAYVDFLGLLPRTLVVVQSLSWRA